MWHLKNGNEIFEHTHTHKYTHTHKLIQSLFIVFYDYYLFIFTFIN